MVSKIEISRILVPVDFTEASKKAVQRARELALKTNARVDMLHIVPSAKDKSEAEKQLHSFAEEADHITAHAVVKQGPVLDTISQVAKDGHYSISVVGTHGARGLRQHLFGADILKLMKDSSCPTMIVQEGTDRAGDIKKILLPVGSHPMYRELLETVASVAEAFGASVTIYRIVRPSDEKNETLEANINKAKDVFYHRNIKWDEWNTDSSVFSFGFAKQTLMDAHSKGYDLIGIMPYSTDSHTYFARADKELLVSNEFNIPILCSKGGE
ncbi:MAG: universal stress protein [Crocinitomicaceae bacterium]|nr:universal stress protein [Crocinitomicaceae bacterium]